MLHKISTPILVAILCYHGYHYLLQYQLKQNVYAYQKEKHASLETKASNPAQQRIVKVTEEIYVAIDYALANSILLIGETGLVIIDTTESELASKEIFKEFRKITAKPVKGIIYTHNHADHVFGTKSFVENSADVEIWAHHTLMEIFVQSMHTVGQAHFIRSMHQFGGLNNDKAGGSAGIGVQLRVDGLTTFIPPNRLLYSSQQDINIARMELKLIHVPGETDDQIAVYWPSKKALFCADDYYKAFPNLYAIRGTPFRSLKKWKESLDTMRNLYAEILVPSHTEPIFGKDEIYEKLTDYRDAIQLVHDQTVRFINKGMHPDDIANLIRLPEQLAVKPYLKELYGTIRWSSKSLFSGYMGWFSGDISELNPYTQIEKAKRMASLAGGIDKMVEIASSSLDENDPQWALTLTSAALLLNGNHRKAVEIKAKSLFGLADLQTSSNGRNYYLTCAYELIGEVQIKVPDSLKKSKIQESTMKHIFDLLSMKIKADVCSHLDKIVAFNFPDSNENIIFHLRNGIMDLSGHFIRKADINVTVDVPIWKEILMGDRSGLLAALSSQLLVEPSTSDLQDIMTCFDNE